MGMSHAAAVWVPGTDVDLKALERMIRESCEHEGLDVELFVRSEPATSVAVAALDDHDEYQMDFDLLNRTAAALASKLQRRVYALYAFFGSGDWMMVNAMNEAGEVAWSEGSSDDGDPVLLEEFSDKLGVEVNGLTLPYWRLIAEVAPGCQDDLLDVGIKPAFDLGFIDGWRSVRTFVTPGLAHESDEPRHVATPAEAIARMSAADVEDLLARTLAKMFPGDSTPNSREVPGKNDTEDVISLALAKLAQREAGNSGRAPKKTPSKRAPAKKKPARKPAAKATPAKKKATARKSPKR